MLHEAVLGTWELVSYTAQDNHGGPMTYPLGPDALGLIMYTGDGYMSAQIMRPTDRPSTVPKQTEVPRSRLRPPPPVTSRTAAHSPSTKAPAF